MIIKLFCHYFQQPFAKYRMLKAYPWSFKYYSIRPATAEVVVDMYPPWYSYPPKYPYPPCHPYLPRYLCPIEHPYPYLIWSWWGLVNFNFTLYFHELCQKMVPNCLEILKIGSKIKVHQNENPSNPSCMTQKAPYIPILTGLEPKLWSVTLKLCQRAKLSVPL